MHGQRVGYIRVSSFDQNPERQLEGVAVDRVFTDQASGKDVRRPELEPLSAKLLQRLKPWKNETCAVPGNIARAAFTMGFALLTAVFLYRDGKSLVAQTCSRSYHSVTIIQEPARNAGERGHKARELT